ncbi:MULTISPECIES: hypothetical protein [unclassified Curtobacterium]|jgi:hypothetical protein|uniref:hypothetical protein n=1 Tax=unclassified Curtobacterium TaxID=257496 RepID=UPI0011CDFB45|nr:MULTISPECIES: hypothetical protein [unclassified Curtobacterium]
MREEGDVVIGGMRFTRGDLRQTEMRLEQWLFQTAPALFAHRRGSATYLLSHPQIGSFAPTAVVMTAAPQLLAQYQHVPDRIESLEMAQDAMEPTWSLAPTIGISERVLMTHLAASVERSVAIQVAAIDPTKAAERTNGVVDLVEQRAVLTSALLRQVPWAEEISQLLESQQMWWLVDDLEDWTVDRPWEPAAPDPYFGIGTRYGARLWLVELLSRGLRSGTAWRMPAQDRRLSAAQRHETARQFAVLPAQEKYWEMTGQSMRTVAPRNRRRRYGRNSPER